MQYGWRSRGYLPHFDHALVIQAITWTLADALPHDVARRLIEQGNDVETREQYQAYLDAGHGTCALRHPHCADLVQQALLHFNHERYQLHAWVVMPNHVHVLMHALPGHDLASILHTWKRHTALAINRLLARNGALWRREYVDRFIRDDRHYATSVSYIHGNPVNAGLVARSEDWPWSSAAARSRPVGNRRSQDPTSISSSMPKEPSHV